MTLREGQQRVQVRPGVWLWLNEADRKALAPQEEAAEPSPAKEPIETAAAEAPERATMPRSQPRKRG